MLRRRQLLNISGMLVASDAMLNSRLAKAGVIVSSTGPETIPATAQHAAGLGGVTLVEDPVPQAEPNDGAWSPEPHKTGPYHTWFESLYSLQGQHCCGVGDCHWVSATLNAEDQWMVYLDPKIFGPSTKGEWVVVDPSLIIPIDKLSAPNPSPEGKAVLCAARYDAKTRYCFVAPPTQG